MTLQQKVFAILSAASGVTAIVPTDRIKPPGDWQVLSRPYVVHFPLSPNPDYASGGQVPLTEWDYQISCFADDYPRAEALAIAVRSALRSFADDQVSFFWRDQRPGPYEPDVKVSHIVLDFTAWTTLY